MTLTTRPEQIENMFHRTREVNSTRVAAVRPRVSARPGPPNRGPAPARHAIVTFGVAAVDARLPGGALPLGALHEIAGGGNGAIDGAAAALFAAGIAARTRGKVLWCLTRLDLFAPALAQAGLNSDRASISKAAMRRPSSPALRKVCGTEVLAPWWRKSRAYP